MLTDPISDMLTRIRNASAAKHAEVIFPFSRIKYEIAKILEREGYIAKVEYKDKTGHDIKAVLKYQDSDSAIRHIARVSKPGKRVYVNYRDVPNVLNGLGMAIISTSQGVMTGGDARKRHLGGEVICEVY